MEARFSRTPVIGAHGTALPSPDEMAALDAHAIASGVPALDLMERAGRAVADAVKGMLAKETKKSAKVTILCGPGNNGGDGLVVARLLSSSTCKVTVILAASEHFSDANKAQLKALAKKKLAVFVAGDPEARATSRTILREQGISVREIDVENLKQSLQCSIVVDALLGTGQRDSPRGSVAFIIEQLTLVRCASQHGGRVVSIDIPSGIDGESGVAHRPCVRAHNTIAIEFPKRGMLQYPALEYCGEIQVASIGISEMVSEQAIASTVEARMVEKPVDVGVTTPRRAPHVHKGSVGQVLVVAGSADMPGAAALAAFAALRSGAGLVRCTTWGSAGELPYPELIRVPVSAQSREEALNIIRPRIKEVECLVIGPGLGNSILGASGICALLETARHKEVPAVIDADALNALASLKGSERAPQLGRAVLTPHPGEAGRLLGIPTKEVQTNRYAAARKLAGAFGAVAILKGACSIVHDGSHAFVNTTGNPYMATAGSGDVLTGMVAGFIAQGLDLREAAILATFAHGLAGDIAHTRHCAPIVASDILAALPQALGTLA